MCFEPAVSLGTAIFEFSIVIVLIAFFRQSLMARFQAVFIFILGFYQLTEFMVCTSGSAALFATLGFVAYTFLPALDIHFFLSYRKGKFPIPLLYIIPALFTAIAVLAKPFVIETSCGIFTVLIKTLIFPPGENFLLGISYWIYYFGYIIAGLLLVYKTGRKTDRLFNITAYLAILLTTVPPLVLLTLLPSTGIVFPSIFCQFAIFYAIFATAAVYAEKRNKLRKILISSSSTSGRRAL